MYRDGGTNDWAFWQLAMMWVGMIGFWAVLLLLVYFAFVRANVETRASEKHQKKRH